LAEAFNIYSAAKRGDLRLEHRLMRNRQPQQPGAVDGSPVYKVTRRPWLPSGIVRPLRVDNPANPV